MTRFVNRVKLAWLRGVEVVATSASNLASNAKFKVAEINLETRRREIMSEFTQKAYDLWQNGIMLPEPLNGMLQEASDLDERLSVLRAQRYAAVESEGEKPKHQKVAEAGGNGKTEEPEAEHAVEHGNAAMAVAVDNGQDALDAVGQEWAAQGEHSQE